MALQNNGQSQNYSVINRLAAEEQKRKLPMKFSQYSSDSPEGSIWIVANSKACTGYIKHSCSKLLCMNSEERMTVVKRLRLCFLRLREGHRAAACNTKGRCQKQAVMDDIILDRTGEYRRRWAVKGCEPSKLYNEDGNSMAINCLFDTGSFVKNSVHEALNLKGPLESVSIEPLGSSGGGCKRVRRVKMCLSPIKDHEIRRQLIEALCLRKISESPNLRLEIKQFSHLAPLKLAEDFTNLCTSFDVLIWLDYYYKFIDQKIIKDVEGEPIAIHSTLGWIVCDSIPENVLTTRIRTMFVKI
ncbi:hypothetical protein T01_4596 [Trichinella spiralis]|uniref:Uncharacterized protein n=1 Tax=Trichinella spiralis TaxID=6334 RepID=A0A0V1BX58_TRISP|nr:hypothetical protein T01_4596 [Trichinella spiralis]